MIDVGIVAGTEYSYLGFVKRIPAGVYTADKENRLMQWRK